VPSTDGPILFEGNPRVQRLYSGSAAAFLLRASAPGLLMLVLAVLAGVASIPATYPDGDQDNLGIFWQANWSLTFVVVVPALLFCTRLLSTRIEHSLGQLEEIEVIVPTDPERHPSLLSEIRRRIRERARLFAILSLLGAAALLIADSFDLVVWINAQVDAMANGELCGPRFAEMDWVSAFADRSCWHDIELSPDFVPVGLWTNVAFDIYAYGLQTFWAFLALLMISKLGLFFYLMADYFGRDDSPFRIEPLWDDPSRRLGLASLGNIYNLMLTMLILFEGYVVLHRFQEVAQNEHSSILSYLRELTVAVGEPPRWLDPELLQLATVDVGTWFSILIIGPFVFVICWFPLFKIRNYIEERRIELTKEYALARKAAKAAGDEAATDAFDRKARALDGSSVWPNGDRTAWRFLYATIALWVGSIMPMAFIILASLLAVPEVLTLAADLINRVLRWGDSSRALRDPSA